MYSINNYLEELHMLPPLQRPLLKKKKKKKLKGIQDNIKLLFLGNEIMGNLFPFLLNSPNIKGLKCKMFPLKDKTYQHHI